MTDSPLFHDHWSRTVAAHGATRRAEYVAGNGDSVPIVITVAENADDLAPGAALVTGAPVAAAPRDLSPDARPAIMFTSGTTSEPKGVVLTQANYATVAQTMAEAVGLTAQHRWLVTLPLFHANAQYYCFAPAITVGASVALTHTFSASGWVQQAHDLEVTHASLFAAPIRMILARTPEQAPPLHLEHVWFAQSLGLQHYERFAELIGRRPRQLYGMTETVAAVTGDTSDPLRHDVIGSALGNRRIAVLDPHTGHPREPGVPGMLLVHGTRGADLFAEYLDAPEVNARSFTDLADGSSWFRTGDLVAADPATGALRFVGRADDVIKVAGENVSLTEVEAVICQAPGVLEAVVLAQPDPIRDQVPVAYVVARDAAAPPDTARLADWAEGNLPPAARPREWHVVGSIPRTSVGKIRRFQVAERRS